MVIQKYCAKIYIVFTIGYNKIYHFNHFKVWHHSVALSTFLLLLLESYTLNRRDAFVHMVVKIGASIMASLRHISESIMTRKHFVFSLFSVVHIT